MNIQENPVVDMLCAYEEAVLAKNVDALAALYDQDVRIFDLWGQWSYSGVEAWRAMVADWFRSLGTDTVIVETNDVQTVLAGDTAVGHAFISYRNVSADGVEGRAMLNRLTWVLRRQAGAWKIAHEHTSAPVDIATSKVMLQR